MPLSRHVFWLSMNHHIGAPKSLCSEIPLETPSRAFDSLSPQSQYRCLAKVECSLALRKLNINPRKIIFPFLQKHLTSWWYSTTFVVIADTKISAWDVVVELVSFSRAPWLVSSQITVIICASVISSSLMNKWKLTWKIQLASVSFAFFGFTCVAS